MRKMKNSLTILLTYILTFRFSFFGATENGLNFIIKLYLYIIIYKIHMSPILQKTHFRNVRM